MDNATVIRALRRAIEAAGSQARFARQIGVTPTFICNVLNGHKMASPKVLTALGLARKQTVVAAGKE